MNSATASLEQGVLDLGTPCVANLSTCKTPIRQMRPNTWVANKSVLQHRRQPFTRLMSSRQRFSRVYATATSMEAANVGAKTSTEDNSRQFQNLHDVVIVGGGIAGLATALALHRLGIKSLLLEQAEQLRTAGAAIGLWTNAWKALEALGVADSLRKKFIKIAGIEFLEQDGSCLLSLRLDEGPSDLELRGVERKALLEALREPLPDGAVIYESRVIGIRKLAGGYTEVECENGDIIQTKVLIGCDGIGSVVAKWMNMGEPRFAGYAATRGLAVYPDGNNLHNEAKMIMGRGVRAGIVPMDANRAYWFMVFNSSGERVTDAELVRKEALDYVKGWSSTITEAINRSSPDNLSRRGIADRWMWPAGGPPLCNNGVTLAGDAMHPMTPNLGQGGCCALEDAVILARALSKALVSNDSRQLNESPEFDLKELERINLALKSYTDVRWRRILPLSIRSYMIGVLLQSDSVLVCSVRNKLLPKLFKLERFIDHSFFDCGTLQ
ncbi:hypothetical protein GOP47_0013372 [Adiantum capillus-veneris]|uniref:FAD-binding domain-containing protein n=1 Tax=Adiantum capillus-veneris TaxID=13818 RepID=A0A9D4UNK6_ADICA|nr:hypothetical protein GOP47_0013372 [Adiantum capillus-veneris]